VRRGTPAAPTSRRAAGRAPGPGPRVAALARRAAVCLLAAGCADEDAAPPPGPPPVEAPAPGAGRIVTVWFSRGEDPGRVEREVDASADVLAATLAALLAGPTGAERADGLSSWFGPATAGALRSVVLEPDGTAVIDLVDVSARIPGASSAAGSERLLDEIGRTIFQFDDVARIELRFDGSCERFWNWIQRECHVLERDGTMTPGRG
jgi:hypothetical protein